jgi:hypothetical protein
VHFTPEHVHQYEWQETSRPDGGTDRAFGANDDAIAKEMLMLVEEHRLIIRVFDRCLEGKILNHPDVKELAQQALKLYRDLLRREGIAKHATSEEVW